MESVTHHTERKYGEVRKKDLQRRLFGGHVMINQQIIVEGTTKGYDMVH